MVLRGGVVLQNLQKKKVFMITVLASVRKEHCASRIVKQGKQF